ncbi:hypothetical protein M8C21_025287 [Ambrosia artemisiifolia]|uniref:Uncharacterized protein n=1 Tax=Ambrosia artemisiifolia TaxID=4212 RepID=A0AAD5C1B8_AMBAR|nr:hypothetical protein M8C21_025287 [Ambrosia artemisiifolia]
MEQHAKVTNALNETLRSEVQRLKRNELQPFIATSAFITPANVSSLR